jgi:hypothetical protein
VKGDLQKYFYSHQPELPVEKIWKIVQIDRKRDLPLNVPEYKNIPSVKNFSRENWASRFCSKGPCYHFPDFLSIGTMEKNDGWMILSVTGTWDI